eukprot:scaffold78636_cov25-Prasinocladus_malaysianus.AAC.1
MVDAAQKVAFLDIPNRIVVCAKDSEGYPMYDMRPLVAPTVNLTTFIYPVDAISEVGTTTAIEGMPGCVEFFYTPVTIGMLTIDIRWNFQPIKDSPFFVQVVNPGDEPGETLSPACPLGI